MCTRHDHSANQSIRQSLHESIRQCVNPSVNLKEAWASPSKFGPSPSCRNQPGRKFKNRVRSGEEVDWLKLEMLMDCVLPPGFWLNLCGPEVESTTDCGSTRSEAKTVGAPPVAFGHV